jgi:hypothetical protein
MPGKNAGHRIQQYVHAFIAVKATHDAHHRCTARLQFIPIAFRDLRETDGIRNKDGSLNLNPVSDPQVPGDWLGDCDQYVRRAVHPSRDGACDSPLP